jgi:hypothetical protein
MSIRDCFSELKKRVIENYKFSILNKDFTLFKQNVPIYIQKNINLNLSLYHIYNKFEFTF